jgi:molecular chaperone GrpE
VNIIASKKTRMAKDESKNDEAIDAAHEGDDPALAAAVSDTDQLTADLAAANDRTLRLQAEMQNLRNRTSREIADERRYAALPVLRDLLPVIDNIDRAIEAAEKAGEAETLLEGFRLVRQQLMTTLSRHQCEPIPAQGELFDPHFHEAILQQPSADVAAGHVMMVTLPGYKLHERVVRPAQVIVSSGPPS